MRSNSYVRNAIPSQSSSFKRKCIVTSARESLWETLRSSERFNYALTRIKASIKHVYLCRVPLKTTPFQFPGVHRHAWRSLCTYCMLFEKPFRSRESVLESKLELLSNDTLIMMHPEYGLWATCVISDVCIDVCRPHQKHAYAYASRMQYLGYLGCSWWARSNDNEGSHHSMITLARE